MAVWNNAVANINPAIEKPRYIGWGNSSVPDDQLLANNIRYFSSCGWMNPIVSCNALKIAADIKTGPKASTMALNKDGCFLDNCAVQYCWNFSELYTAVSFCFRALALAYVWACLITSHHLLTCYSAYHKSSKTKSFWAPAFISPSIQWNVSLEKMFALSSGVTFTRSSKLM